MVWLLIPQFSLSFGPDGMNRRLLKEDFVMGEVPVSGRQILQFILQHSQMFFLVVVDCVQGGFIALFLECWIPHFFLINQGLASWLEALAG